MKKIKLLICPVLLLSSVLVGCGAKPQPVDGEGMIVGNIITMDESNPTAEAIAYKDGKIVAIGKKEEVAKKVSSGVATTTLNAGEYLYPGFVDTHTHYAVMTSIMTGALMFDREKSGEGGYELGDYGAYANLMNNFVKQNPNNEYYQGYGLWVAKTQKYGDEPPTRQILDDIVETNKPIVVVGGGGHDCWLNTAAIKKYVGNFEGTEEEKKAVDKWILEVGEDCVIHEKDGNGHIIPKGYFCETARFRITDQLEHSVEGIKDTIKGFQESTLVKGYTTAGDCTIVENDKNKQVTAFKELSNEGALKLKYRSYYEIREYDSKETRAAELKKAIALAQETKDNDHFQIVGIKVFLDGVYEALSSYMLNEYTPEAGKRSGYKGIQRWYPGEARLNEELNELVYEVNKAGLAMEFHAMGDGAIKQALDACEYAAEKLGYKKNGEIPNFKNAISHLGYIDPNGISTSSITEGLKDIERFAKLGVTAVVAPEWGCNAKSIYPLEKKVLGETKVEDMYKIKSIMDTGANVAFHTDGAVMGGVPEMIYDATTRLDASHDDSTLRGAGEKLTGMQSLKCLTTNAAYALHSESTKGYLKAGEAADFSIYNKDYRDDSVATNLNSFKTAQLIGLYVNGVNQIKKSN